VEGKFRLLLVGAAAGVAFALAGIAYGTGTNAKASDTLVFGAAADPVLLDPALISDGESLRDTGQMFESLTGYKPGTTKIEPKLATSWTVSKNGLSYTFNLRTGVTFHDGTKFDAAAVCFNYDRWYNFPAPLQNSSVSYYYNTVFGGFAHPAKGNPGPAKALYKSCKAMGTSKVQINLRHPSGSFLNTIALPNFAISSPTALKKYKADAGTTDSQGVFHPSGSFATQHPVGTGPYMLESWQPGNRLVLTRYDKYWGHKAILKRIIFRPIADNAARLQALQSGEIQAYDNVAPEDFGTIKGNSKLKLLSRPVNAVGYVGINQAIKPMDNPQVRQAIAYGLDRQGVVGAFYGGQGKVANQFLPPGLDGFVTKGLPSYPYNPDKAKSLLKQAGVDMPLKIDFWYPTSVSRPYMPDPKKNAEAFAASLEKSGFSVTFHSAPWRPDYLATTQAGKAEVYLLGWIADYFDPADFLNVHFGAYNTQFGFKDDALFKLLAKADATSNADARAGLFQQAGIAVMKSLPVVPYVWASSPVATTANVSGYIPSPIGPPAEPLALVKIS
jgi:peptide/nickel transport system substrate-binding protein